MYVLIMHIHVCSRISVPGDSGGHVHSWRLRNDHRHGEEERPSHVCQSTSSSLHPPLLHKMRSVLHLVLKFYFYYFPPSIDDVVC